ncbi:MAG: N-acetylmuramoyl-L-alanine amidase [Clostridia bacterium]|nr:N-acetylmuramoyl-L-alanine amidase [Clostridia bacterium]
MNRNRKIYFSAAVAFIIALFAAYQGSGKGGVVTVMSGAVEKPRTQVVLDAGHGGEDGGAVGTDGTKESGLNLSIAKKLRDMLSLVGYDVILTRDSDCSIHDPDIDSVKKQKTSDLKNRLEIVNSHPDCVFISIHQNKFNSPKYTGAQVFYSKNNADSEKYARSIQNAIVALVQPDNTRQIKNIGSTSYIMRNAKPPSVLVECGFVSNPDELGNLKNDEYQSRIAFAVMCGFVQAQSSP